MLATSYLVSFTEQVFRDCKKCFLLHNEFSFAALLETIITRRGKITKKCFVKKISCQECRVKEQYIE